MNNASKHYYIEEKINEIFLNTIDDLYDIGLRTGLITINRIIREAVKVGLVEFKEPEKVGTLDETKILNEVLKDTWVLVYNACETGSEWSDAFIVTADSKKDAEERFKNSKWFSQRPDYKDGYMLLVQAFKPDADLLLRKTPYLQIYWLDKEIAYAEKLDKDNKAFDENPQKAINEVLVKVNKEFSKMIEPESLP